MDGDGLNSNRLYAVACRLTSPADIRRLGHHLGIEDYVVEAALQNHKDDIQEAGYAILQNWFKGQEDNKQALVTLRRALCHPTVNLSNIAAEALPSTINDSGNSSHESEDFESDSEPHDNLINQVEELLKKMQNSDDIFINRLEEVHNRMLSVLEMRIAAVLGNMDHINMSTGKPESSNTSTKYLTARVLSDTHIQLLSHKLNMDDMYRLAVKLDISPEDVEADFAKFCTNKTVVIHNTLDQWMKGQDSREEAYRKLVEALIHPDVGLNLLAREVLGYTIITSDLLTNRGKLVDHHLEKLSTRLNKEEIYRLGRKLGIPSRQIDASFMKFCSSEKDAILHILSRWLKRQNSREEAYLVLGDAMIHPDVRLNLIAKEVLGYSK